MSPESTPRFAQVIQHSSGHWIEAKPEILVERYKEQAPDKSEQRQLITGLIKAWPNLDVWPFKFGVLSLGITAAATAGFLNRTFRQALYLDYRMRISSYLGLMAVSGLSTAVWHDVLVTSPILKNMKNQCPVCLQVRAALLQFANGVIYPVVLSPVVSYVVASSFKDRHLPKIYKRPKDVVGYTKSVFKPIKGVLGAMAIGQVILAMGVTYFEQECFYSKILPVLEGRETFAKKPPEMD